MARALPQRHAAPEDADNLLTQGWIDRAADPEKLQGSAGNGWLFGTCCHCRPGERQHWTAAEHVDDMHLEAGTFGSGQRSLPLGGARGEVLKEETSDCHVDGRDDPFPDEEDSTVAFTADLTWSPAGLSSMSSREHSFDNSRDTSLSQSRISSRSSWNSPNVKDYRPPEVQPVVRVPLLEDPARIERRKPATLVAVAEEPARDQLTLPIRKPSSPPKQRERTYFASPPAEENARLCSGRPDMNQLCVVPRSSAGNVASYLCAGRDKS